MPRASKPLEPLDLQVAEVLNDLLRESGVSRNSIVVKAGIGNMRGRKIFFAESPAPTIGELNSLAVAFNTTASALLAEAEARLAASTQAAPEPEVARIPVPGDPDFEHIPPSEKDAWRLAANFTREDVERSKLEEIGEESQVPPEEWDE